MFDLDDTLFEEMTFVKSGFKAVAKFLNQSYNLNEFELFDRLVAYEKGFGRGKVFDIVLRDYDVYTKFAVRKCITIYRQHNPVIELFPDAIRCLERLRGSSVYIVTDGNKLVQQRKIAALGLSKWVKFSFITYRFGIKHSKPSPYCFLKICKIEKCNPSEVTCIADNPKKDFIGIKPLGFKTVRVLRGNYKDLRLDQAYEADLKINNLDDLKIEDHV
ncbi:MAG: HAD family hydrolase [Cyclobacteriaceae bacterium]